MTTHVKHSALTYPTGACGGQTTTEYLIDPQKFHNVFAAGADVIHSMATCAGDDITEISSFL